MSKDDRIDPEMNLAEPSPTSMNKHPMHRHCCILLPLAFLLTVMVASARADDETDSASDTEPKAVSLTGTFEAIRSFEISAQNEHLTDLKIQKVAPHASAVSKGQTLVWFEAEGLDEKLRKAEHELALAKLAMESEEFAYQQFLKTQQLDRDKAKRDRQIAQQNYDNYLKTDRDREIKSAKFSLESSKFSLESATEEYRQLEQMYKEDDLTEESEEIVLRRAKQAMESAAFSLEGAEIRADRTVHQTVPRNDASEEEKLARANLAYESAIQEIGNAKQKRALEIQQKRDDLKEKINSVEEMREERKRIVLKSPADGFFFYGELDRGKLSAKPAVLKAGSSVSPTQVIGTVADPKRLQVRIDLAEQHLDVVKEGVECEIKPTGHDETSINGIVKSVAAVPFVPGKYDCVVTLKGRANAELAPAMGCEVIIELAAEEDQ